jgi:hypothetical protein
MNSNKDNSLYVILIYLLTQLGVIFFIYPEYIIRSTEEAHWIAIVVGVIINVIIVAVYLKGLSYFKNKDIIDAYFSLGKGVGIVFLLPILIYLLISIIATLSEFAEMISIVFLTSTPLWAITSLLIIVSLFISMNGILAIFRTGVLIAVLFLPLLLFIIFMSLQNVDYHYIFPLVNHDFSFLGSKAFLKSFFTFSATFIFLGFIPPYFSFKTKKILISMAAIIPFLLLAVYIPVLTFGRATVTTLKFPFGMVMTTVYVNWLVFERFTMFLLLCLIAFTILFMAVILWQSSEIVKRCIPGIRQIYITLLVGIITFVGCLMIQSMKQIEQLITVNSVLRLYILIVVPLSIYFIGLRYKRKGLYEKK